MAFDTKSDKKNKASLSVDNNVGHNGVDLWKEVVEHLLEPVARFNRQFQLIFVNHAFLNLIRNDGKDVIGKTNDEVAMPAQIAADWSTVLRTVFETGQTGEMSSVFPFGDEVVCYTMKFIPEWDDQEHIHSVMAIGRDITEINKAARELREHKALLRQIMDAPNVGIGVFRALKDEKGVVTDFQVEFVNSRTLQTFGDKDPTGTLLSSHATNNPEQWKYFEEVIATGKKNYYSRQTKSGMVDRWFLFSNVPLGNDRLVQVWEDISEIKTKTTKTG